MIECRQLSKILQVCMMTKCNHCLVLRNPPKVDFVPIQLTSIIALEDSLSRAVLCAADALGPSKFDSHNSPELLCRSRCKVRVDQDLQAINASQRTQTTPEAPPS